MTGRIDSSFSLRDLSLYSKEMEKLVPHLVVFGNFPFNPDIKLTDNGIKQGELLAEALNYLDLKMKEGVGVIQNVYTDEEKKSCKAKEKTSLMFIPGKKGGKSVFITSGGAYMGVYNLFEGVSCGYYLAKLGYNVFVITYRVCRYPVVDNAMEDIARSYNYIKNHKELYDVDLTDYVFMGMSAGGHLAGEWGTLNVGSSVFGIPRPKALLLGYPALSTIDFLEDMENFRYTPGHIKVLRLYLNLIGGRNCGRKELTRYSVEYNMDKDYPKVYLIHSKDDDKVNFSTAQRMQKAMEDNDIPHIVKIMDKGGHGFGPGFDTLEPMWLTEAINFSQS